MLHVDGQSVDEIRAALRTAGAETERPTIIIGRTVMGKGAVAADGTSYENKVSTHGQPLSAAGADIAATVKHLGGDPENPFTVFEESKEIYAARREELRAWVKAQKAVEAEWRSANKELARKLDMFLASELPAIDYKSIEMKADSATRAASATVLGVLAERVENMIVASGRPVEFGQDRRLPEKTKAFTKGDFSGKFFQAGVSELTMACIMNGMALHGGVIPACGTFFVFSDYMKPAVRLSALMHLHVIYIWTHDSFRVGEDGPTHQPIEHEAQIRLMEHLRNHAGERSMVVLRPADGEETISAWRLALEEKRPVALILSRQNIKNLPALAASRREEAAQLAKGAYIVADTAKPDVVMVASGSEVATLVEGAGLLAQEGIKARIVSVPSEGLFRDQPQSYQESVLPAGIARYGMTSGLPVTLQGLVGEGLHPRPRYVRLLGSLHGARQGVRLQRRDRRRRSQETVGTRIARFTAETARVSESIGHPRCFSPKSHPGRNPRGTLIRNHPHEIPDNSPVHGTVGRGADSPRRRESFGSFSGVFRLRHDEQGAPANARTDPQKQRPQPESCGRKTFDGNRHQPKFGEKMPGCSVLYS